VFGNCSGVWQLFGWTLPGIFTMKLVLLLIVVMAVGLMVPSEAFLMNSLLPMMLWGNMDMGNSLFPFMMLSQPPKGGGAGGGFASNPFMRFAMLNTFM